MSHAPEDRNGFQPLAQTDTVDDSGSNDSLQQEKEAPRAAWDNKLQFILSIIGYAVGLGNVWRFPYLCQENGGGAFLIPYILLMCVEGIPLQFLEVAIGQRKRKGAVALWREISPYLSGLGWASVVVSYLLAMYYNVLIMWSFFYLFSSFTSTLPWQECPTYTEGNVTLVEPECEMSDSTSYFFYREALDISPAILQMNGVKWKMCLCLLFTWLVTFLCLFRGIKSSGKVMYVTATFPYLVLTIFFVRAVMLPGASAGLRHLFLPRISRLIDPTVWLAAGIQVFYSLGLGFGGLIAFASYTPPKNNCQRDTILVCIANLLTSFYCGIVVFAVLGFKAHNINEKCIDHNIESLLLNGHYPHLNHSTLTHDVYLNQLYPSIEANETLKNMTNLTECDITKEIEKAAQGTGLAFIVFTQVVSEFPAAPFWSILFFLMLLTLGMGSIFGAIECVITSVYDANLLPKRIPDKLKKPIITGILCSSSFLFGLVFVTGAGEYWVKLFDRFAASSPIIIIAVLEIVAVCYIYGIDKFSADIEFMLGHPPHKIWIILWKFICPTLLIVLFVASMIQQFLTSVKYYRYDRATASLFPDSYPDSIIPMILFLSLASPMCLPIMALYKHFRPDPDQAAKTIQTRSGGHTQSTAAFLKSGQSIGRMSSPEVELQPTSPTEDKQTVNFDLDTKLV